MARTRFSVYDMDAVTNEDLVRIAHEKGEYEKELENLEPYDPAYVTDAPYEIPDISGYEKRFNRKISIIENKLRKNHIRYEWLEAHEMFRVWKFRYEEKPGKVRKKDGTPLNTYKVYSEYPTYQYIAVYMETNEYAFGGWEEDQCVSTRISDVINSVMEWLDNNEPGLK